MKLLLTFFLAGVIALAGPINGPANVTLVNAGNGLDDGSYDIGTYTLAIDGKNYGVMCVDFKDDSYVGASWDANFTDLASSDFSKTYLGNSADTAATYEEEAYLYSLLQGSNDATQRTNIQRAAWYLTDPAYGLSSGAQTELSIAEQNYDSRGFQATLGNFEIVSDVNMASGRQQEFVVRAETPEPRSLALIGAGLLLITGLLRKVVLKKEIEGR